MPFGSCRGEVSWNSSAHFTKKSKRFWTNIKLDSFLSAKKSHLMNSEDGVLSLDGVAVLESSRAAVKSPVWNRVPDAAIQHEKLGEGSEGKEEDRGERASFPTNPLPLGGASNGRDNFQLRA